MTAAADATHHGGGSLLIKLELKLVEKCSSQNKMSFESHLLLRPFFLALQLPRWTSSMLRGHLRPGYSSTSLVAKKAGAQTAC